eukprot:5880093-Pyramimonas_sp.AAC.1
MPKKQKGKVSSEISSLSFPGVKMQHVRVGELLLFSIKQLSVEEGPKEKLLILADSWLDTVSRQ